MFSLPFSFFVILYALFVLVTLSFALINIYHIVATGTLSLLSFFVSALVVLLMLGVIIATSIFLGAIDLSQTFTLFNPSTSVPL